MPDTSSLFLRILMEYFNDSIDSQLLSIQLWLLNLNTLRTNKYFIFRRIQ